MYLTNDEDVPTREEPVFRFLDAYAPLFYYNHRYFLISGGRAGGKTYNTVAYCIYKLFSDEYVRIVVARYTQRSIKSSIYRDILDLLERFNLMGFITFQGEDIVNLQNGNRIMTHSFKMTDKAAVAKSKGIANPTILIVDEAQEIPNAESYIQLNDSFRSTQGHTQIILLFNPESKAHWIYKRWYLNGLPNPAYLDDHCFIHTTYKDNAHNLDPLKIREWERMRDIDPKYFSKHILGEWQNIAEGNVYDNWKPGFDPDPEAKRVVAIDFGFSNDPTAVIDVRLKNNRMWVRELFYGTSMTNQDLVEILKANGISRTDTIIADSAEPKSIEEIRRAGFSIRGAVKGPDSVRSGISKMLAKEVYVDVSSKNIWNEYENYRWTAGTNKPIDDYNHALDAIRYALSGETSGQYVLMR
jgi:phage terminase large subunit